MAIENLYADGVVANNGCTSPTNAQGSADGTWTGNTSADNWDCRWSIADPAGPLTPSATQTINVTIRKSDGGGGRDPDYTVDLYQGGSLVASLASGTLTTDTATVGGTFTDSDISDGSAVEILVSASGSGGPPNDRRTIQVDAIEWVADASESFMYDETGLTVDAVTTTTLTDVGSFVDVATVAAISAVTGADSLTYPETLAVDAAGTLSVVDAYVYTENLDVGVASTTSAVDAQSVSESLNVAITATVLPEPRMVWGESLWGDTWGIGVVYSGERLNLAITSTVTVDDTFVSGSEQYDETGKTVSGSTSISGSDVARLTDPLTADLTSGITGSDVATRTDVLSVDASTTISIESTASLSDSLAIDAVAGTTLSDTASLADAVSFAAATTITLSDVKSMSESGAVDAVLGVTGLDAALFNEPCNVGGTVQVSIETLALLGDSLAFTADALISVVEIFNQSGYERPIVIVGQRAGRRLMRSDEATRTRGRTRIYRR